MEVCMRTRTIRLLARGGSLALALAVAGLVAAPAEAATLTPAAVSYPVYFAGGGEGTTRAAAEAAAQSDADADEAAYEAETGTTCTIISRSGGASQLAPSWWGAYVLETAACA
jgi:uncharacterized membrane protein